MRLGIVVLCISFGVLGFSNLRANPQLQKPSPCCQIVEQALEEAKQVKVGEKRSDVERQFELDGGMQFPESSRYILTTCGDIKIKVDFKLSRRAKDPSAPLMNPDDTVTEVSQPYLEYPFKE